MRPQPATMAVPEKVSEPSLSTAINLSVKDLHDDVNFGIVYRLSVSGLNDYRLYREGILTFSAVYKTWETSTASLLESSSSLPPNIATALRALSIPMLCRAEPMQLDLEYLFNSSAPASAYPRPVLEEYIQYMQTLLREKPHCVVAYAHNYYMALFAGGRILAGTIEKAKQIFPVHAPAENIDDAVRMCTNLFRFAVSGKEEENKLREKFRAGMVVAGDVLSETEWTDILDESRAIYEWNLRLMKELDAISASAAAVYGLPIPAQPTTENIMAMFAGRPHRVPKAITAEKGGYDAERAVGVHMLPARVLGKKRLAMGAVVLLLLIVGYVYRLKMMW